MKKLLFSELLSVYERCLTTKQQSVSKQYYHLDYSLGEIAFNEKTTKQAVKNSLSLAEKTMLELEKNLALNKKFSLVREVISSTGENKVRDIEKIIWGNN